MLPDDLASAGIIAYPGHAVWLITSDPACRVAFCLSTLAENVNAARAYLARREQLRQAEAERRAVEFGKPRRKPAKRRLVAPPPQVTSASAQLALFEGDAA